MLVVVVVVTLACISAVGVRAASHWTLQERYMGTPLSNPSGYKESSVLTHASKLQGRLMLIHGLIDEVRHMRWLRIQSQHEHSTITTEWHC